METIEDLKTMLMGAGPVTLIFLGSLVLGYMLKTIPFFPNWLIPFVNVPVASVGFRFTQPIAQDDFQTWNNPNLRLYIIGSIIGFAAWIAHDRYLKNWIDKKVWPAQPPGDSSKPTTNETMNKTILTVALLAFATIGQAQQGSKTPPTDSIILKERALTNNNTKKEEPAPVFTAGEYQLELAGQARTVDLQHYDKSITVGGNYWAMQGAGLHAAAGFRDLTGHFVDRVEFGLVGRFTFDKFNLALLFGVGAEWQQIQEYVDLGNDQHEKSMPPEYDKRTRDDWAVYAEAGPVFRIHRNIDIFAKVRGVRPIDGADGEHIALIAGISLTGRR